MHTTRHPRMPVEPRPRGAEGGAADKPTNRQRMQRLLLLCLCTLLLACSNRAHAQPHNTPIQQVLAGVEQYETARDAFGTAVQSQLQLRSFVNLTLATLTDSQTFIPRDTCERLVKRVHIVGFLLVAADSPAVPVNALAADQALQSLILALATARSSAAGVSDDAARWSGASSLYCRALALRTIHSVINVDSLFGSRAQLFAAMPLMSNFYYASLLRSAPLSLVSATPNRHLQQLLRPDWFQSYTSFDENMHALVYGVSYINPHSDRFFKKHVNQVLQHVIAQNPSAYPRFDSAAAKPKPRTVALVSQFYFPTHSVYRTFKAYVDALCDAGFRVTFFNIGPLHSSLTPDLLTRFEAVEPCVQGSDHDKALYIAQLIVARKFAFVFYPAVGMSWTDVFLSNLRLAPLQLAGLGHSVSGFGNEIDVMISGESTEVLWKAGATETAKATRSVFPHDTDASPAPSSSSSSSSSAVLQPRFFTKEYTETLLLLPGQGIIHELPLFPRADILRIAAAAAASSAPADRVIINLSASPQKVGVKYIRSLAAVIKQLLVLQSADGSLQNGTESPVVPKLIILRFFPHLSPYLYRRSWMGGLLDSFSRALQGRKIVLTAEMGAQGDTTAQAPMTAFLRIFAAAAGDAIAPSLTLQLEVYADLPYASYLPLLASADLSLESAPYGGCNTVVDSLWSGVPLLLWDGGQRWHHRIGSAIVHEWMPQQIAAQMMMGGTNSHKQFEERAVQFITRPLFRAALARQLRALDIESIMVQMQGLPASSSSSSSSSVPSRSSPPPLASAFPSALHWLSRQRSRGRFPPTLSALTRTATIAQQQESIKSSLLRSPVFLLREELEAEKREEQRSKVQEANNNHMQEEL